MLVGLITNERLKFLGTSTFPREVSFFNLINSDVDHLDGNKFSGTGEVLLETGCGCAWGVLSVLTGLEVLSLVTSPLATGLACTWPMRQSNATHAFRVNTIIFVTCLELNSNSFCNKEKSTKERHKTPRTPPFVTNQNTRILADHFPQ